MEQQQLEPLRRAVIPPGRPPRRWLYGAIALSIGSAAAAATAAVVVAMREPPPPAEIRLVEIGPLGHWQPPPSTCGHPYLQYTVYRPQLATMQYDVGAVFGIPLQLTCIYGAHGNFSITRSAGLDKVFGTHDDACWTSTVTCAELARMHALEAQKISDHVKTKTAPKPKPKR